MSDSLRDLLLKSGLVSKLKAEAKPQPPPLSKAGAGVPRSHSSIAKNKLPKSRTDKVSTNEELDLAKAYALRARQEQQERDRQEREVAERAREKRERKEKLQSLLRGSEQNDATADLPRHFSHGDKIRRVYCTSGQLIKLNSGELGIVQFAGRYLLVERDIALQTQTINPQALVLLCDPNAVIEDDIPTDLIW